MRSRIMGIPYEIQAGNYVPHGNIFREKSFTIQKLGQLLFILWFSLRE